ncbi:hypothetical protein CCR75_001731 [Bremia lactucae]|uniref:Uncharacterized protein n=1 Tax=Bremia lactucae TaxID=4779 RepID=A0A976FGH4_BRELC|nr:hypothetical protein CCR75_001731 [Bremia lactucae]
MLVVRPPASYRNVVFAHNNTGHQQSQGLSDDSDKEADTVSPTPSLQVTATHPTSKNRIVYNGDSRLEYGFTTSTPE